MKPTLKWLAVVFAYQLLVLFLVFGGIMVEIFRFLRVAWNDQTWRTPVAVSVGWLMLEAPLLIVWRIGWLRRCRGRGTPRT